MQLRVFIATAGLVLGLGAAGAAAAGPTTVLTISCDAATGVNIVYGVDMADRLKAIESHTRIPGPKYYPPSKAFLPKTLITLQSDGTAEVTYEWPQKLGGANTVNMRMLGWLNEFAFTLLAHGDPASATDADLITFYPHESVAFFSGNDYSGYAGSTGRPENQLTGYTFFARCRYNGLFWLRDEEQSFNSTDRPLLK